MRQVRVLALMSMILLVLAAATSVFAAGDVDIGATAYKTLKCAKCHGDGGAGDGPTAAKLKAKGKDIEMHNWTDKDAMSKHTDDDLKKITVEGGKALGKSTQMPSYQKKIKKENINVDDLIAFVRSLAS